VTGTNQMRSVSVQPGSRRLLLILALTLVAASTVRAQTGNSLRIVPLVREDRVLVSFDLQDGFTDEVRAAIKSGLKTTFTYSIDLRLDVPGWVDRTIGTSTIGASVEYDNLTRRYTVTRVIDGHVEETKVTEDERVAREYLTSLAHAPLFRTSVLEANRDYYIRIRATARPSNGSILWPFGSGTSAMAKFTFVR
jgi:hypothetical protein